MTAIGELTGFLTRESNASKSSQPNGQPDEKLFMPQRFERWPGDLDLLG